MNNDQASEQTEAEYLISAVSELNQSIAYLSKMVLQLQRSINEQKPQKSNAKQQTSQPKEPPVTIH